MRCAADEGRQWQACRIEKLHCWPCACVHAQDHEADILRIADIASTAIEILVQRNRVEISEGYVRHAPAEPSFLHDVCPDLLRQQASPRDALCIYGLLQMR